MTLIEIAITISLILGILMGAIIHSFLVNNYVLGLMKIADEYEAIKKENIELMVCNEELAYQLTEKRSS